MATNTPAQLSTKLRSFSKGGLQRAQRKGVEAAAFEIKATIVPFMQSASGGDLRLSGVGSRKMRDSGGAKIGVVYDKVVGHVNPSATVRAVGPAHLLERGSRPHQIPRAKSRKLSSGARGRSRNSQRRPLNINGRWVTGPVQHPGWSGKHPWKRGLAVAVKRAPKAFAKFLELELRRSFGG